MQLLSNPRFKTVICLSFRIVFTTEFAIKYNLTSYQSIVGPLNLKDNPRIIVQVDSLFRLDSSMCPDLLIIDEVESILSKVKSSSNSYSVINQFLHLISRSPTVVVMDALMEKTTIKYLNDLKGTDNY